MYGDPIVLLFEILILAACVGGGWMWGRNGNREPAYGLVGGVFLALVLILIVRIVLLGHV